MKEINISEQYDQDEKLFNDQKEKYLILLKTLSKADEKFAKIAMSKVQENLQKLPAVEKLIHVCAFIMAANEVGIGISMDNLLKRLKEFTKNS